MSIRLIAGVRNAQIMENEMSELESYKYKIQQIVDEVNNSIRSFEEELSVIPSYISIPINEEKGEFLEWNKYESGRKWLLTRSYYKATPVEELSFEDKQLIVSKYMDKFKEEALKTIQRLIKNHGEQNE